MNKFSFRAKTMKKVILAIVVLAISIFAAVFLIPGFTINSSAYIEDYSVSEDGKEITIKVGVSSSVGQIRKITVSQQFGGKLYLDCYGAFGGINGSIGAKDTFTFPLLDDTAIIAFNRGGAYQEVLLKGEDGSWKRR